MSITTRQKMQIACILAGTTIEKFAHEHGVSDMSVHHLLSGRKIQGKKSSMLVKKIDGFIAKTLAKYNMTDGNHVKSAAA